MLTYSLHTNSSPHPRFDSGVRFNRDVAFVPQTALRSDRYSRSGEDGEQSRDFTFVGNVVDQAHEGIEGR